MKRLNISFAVLLLVVSAGYYWSAWPVNSGEPDADENVAAAPAPASTPDRTPREQIAAAYRLRPDRRCLQALSELHRVVSGAPPIAPEAAFADGQWKIRYHKQPAGALPEFPDFPDLLRFLTNYAGRMRLATALKLEPAGEPRAEISRRLEALQAVSAAWHADTFWRQTPRDMVLLRQGMQALVLLAFLDVDRAGASDLVAARALAALALVESATGPARREECLLAQAMGYYSHAYDLAAQLPSTDPLRHYIRRDDAALEAAAHSLSSRAETQYLYARSLADKRDLSGWLRHLDRHAHQNEGWSLPLLQSSLSLGWLETRSELSGMLASQVLREVSRLGHMPVAQPDESTAPLARIETALDHIDIPTGGPFLDRDTLQAYYRGCYYSALQELGLHLLDPVSSVKAAGEFAESLGAAPAGPAAEFKNWFVHLAQSKAGHGNAADLENDIGSLTAFGLGLSSRTFEELERLEPYGTATLLNAGRALAARLDTRPEHRLELGLLVHNEILSLAFTERTLAGVAPPGKFNNLEFQDGPAANSQREQHEQLKAAPPDGTLSLK